MGILQEMFAGKGGLKEGEYADTLLKRHTIDGQLVDPATVSPANELPLPLQKSVTKKAATMQILDWVKDIRQPDHFSCGAACFAAIANAIGSTKPIKEWKKLLGTDVEESTKPSAIVNLAQALGFQVEARGNMDVANLENCLSRDMPVIVCVQDYGPEVSSKAKFDYGHYLVIIGVGGGYIFAQDPSEDNVVAGSDKTNLSKTGSIQKPGRIMIAQNDFLRMWHDKDVDGNKYIRYGIAIGPPKPSKGRKRTRK